MATNSKSTRSADGAPLQAAAVTGIHGIDALSKDLLQFARIQSTVEELVQIHGTDPAFDVGQTVLCTTVATTDWFLPMTEHSITTVPHSTIVTLMPALFQSTTSAAQDALALR